MILKISLSLTVNQIKQHRSTYNMGGGPTPFLPMEKSIWKEREMNTFPFLSIYFFPVFPHGEKWENTHFSMGKNGVGPPHNMPYNSSYDTY